MNGMCTWHTDELFSDFAGEDSFLAFAYRKDEYVIPVSDVEMVTETPPEGAHVLQGDAACFVISNVSGTLLAIGADTLHGLVNIQTGCQFDLPQAARSPGNEWIFGVADLGGENNAAFLLDCHVLARQIQE